MKIGTCAGREVRYGNGVLYIKGTSIAVFNVKEKDAVDTAQRNFKDFRKETE